MKIYSIKDVKIGFNNPFLQVNEEVAIRTFEAAINDERGSFYMYPQDMELWELGEFNETTGIISANYTPNYIIGGKDVCSTRRTKDQ